MAEKLVKQVQFKPFTAYISMVDKDDDRVDVTVPEMAYAYNLMFSRMVGTQGKLNFNNGNRFILTDTFGCHYEVDFSFIRKHCRTTNGDNITDEIIKNNIVNAIAPNGNKTQVMHRMKVLVAPGYGISNYTPLTGVVGLYSELGFVLPYYMLPTLNYEEIFALRIPSHSADDIALLNQQELSSLIDMRALKQYNVTLSPYLAPEDKDELLGYKFETPVNTNNTVASNNVNTVNYIDRFDESILYNNQSLINYDVYTSTRNSCKEQFRDYIRNLATKLCEKIGVQGQISCVHKPYSAIAVSNGLEYGTVNIKSIIEFGGHNRVIEVITSINHLSNLNVLVSTSIVCGNKNSTYNSSINIDDASSKTFIENIVNNMYNTLIAGSSKSNGNSKIDKLKYTGKSEQKGFLGLLSLFSRK
ncbi:MAG: hypothetical protein IJ593_05035 [Lachnospiraceae bacterium]|nr:hypothetical protein [Lachnospiraceae bacterium]